MLSHGQSNIHLQVLTLSSRFLEDTNTKLFKTSLDQNGRLLLEPGLFASYEFYVRDLVLALRTDQAVYLDAAGKFAGLTSFGIRARMFKRWKHSMHFGLGPALAYRQSWVGIQGYQEDDRFTETGGLQYNLVFLTGGLEHNYFLNKNHDLSTGINYLYPNRLVLSIGIRYWISTRIRFRHACNTCPKF